ncbi:hypothetical protein D3C84_1038050 [compost metagenome]
MHIANTNPRKRLLCTCWIRNLIQIVRKLHAIAIIHDLTEQRLFFLRNNHVNIASPFVIKSMKKSILDERLKHQLRHMCRHAVRRNKVIHFNPLAITDLINKHIML